MFIRKIGKFLRGSATPFQIISATLLGGLLGALPGLTQGPLLLVILLFLVIVLNANLFLATLTLLLVRLLTLLLLPLYFNIGVFLLEGGLGQVVAPLVNAPVTAWFGLEYYVTIPSLLVGGIAGLLLGIGMSRTVKGFRRRMANLETGSERYQEYASKFWVRALAWLFFGGLRGKKSWSEMEELKRGLPVRPIGIFFCVSLLVLGYVGLQLLDETILTSYARDGLEKANGATVDIRGISIEPAANRVTITGLAMADPEALDTNRFSSSEIIADLSGMSLLAKKVVVDSVRVMEPAAGTERKITGRRIARLPEPEEKPEEEGVVNIDDYLGKATVWRERLRAIKRVYDRIAPLVGEKESGDGEAAGWRERLAQRAKEEGYAAVQCESLVREAPRIWIRDLKTDNLTVAGSEDTYVIEGSNLSSQPALLEERGRLSIASADGRITAALGLPSSGAPNRSVVEFSYKNLPVADLENSLGKDLPMDGGSMDIEGEGSIDAGVLALPLKVTLKNTTLNAFGTSLPLDSLPLEVSVNGPIDQPVLRLPEDAIREAVTAGGRKKVEGLIKEKAGDKLKDLIPFGG
ncbi:MAG: hypothetical protein ACP5I4_06370 [Oceanipulchritudo sp.]